MLIVDTGQPWPYPRWVAHRGAGGLAPENTLAAFRLGASHGYRMFECDVKLSADGIPFLLHDSTLERTTNSSQRLRPDASPVAAQQPWNCLSQLDAGSWHSPAFAGETLPSLEAIARFCLHNAYLLNIEIKPSPGLERETGMLVAQHAARLWQDAAIPPLLTSFQPDALAAAGAAQAHLPRGLLLESLPNGWLDTARSLGCVAIVCKHTLWDNHSVAQTKAVGMRCLSYTVNDETAVQRLLGLGTDGIITDRVDIFSPLR